MSYFDEVNTKIQDIIVKHPTQERKHIIIQLGEKNPVIIPKVNPVEIQPTSLILS